MRFLVLSALSLLALAAAAAAEWVVKAEPAWYLRARYPLEYQRVIRSHARSYDLDPAA
jgi:soluble lytic murein transglycosylase-like protein